MLRFTLLFFIFLKIAVASEVNKDFKCVEVEKIANTANPVDLAYGIADCIKQDSYKNGLEMYLLLGVYGQFDKRRVVDKTAHQAISVLKMHISNMVPKEKRGLWLESANEVTKEENMTKMCAKIKKIGMPTYYPSYMIAHGLEAFDDVKKSGVYDDFQKEVAWNTILSEYLKCK